MANEEALRELIAKWRVVIRTSRSGADTYNRCADELEAALAASELGRCKEMSPRDRDSRCRMPEGHDGPHVSGLWCWPSEVIGGTVGLDQGATDRDWATDGPALEKRALEAEAKLAAAKQEEHTDKA